MAHEPSDKMSDPIAENAAKYEAQAENESPEVRLAKLEERIAALEPILEAK